MSIEMREASAPVRYTLNGATMGTRYSAAFFAPEGVDEAAIGAALFAAVDAVDRQMSSWKPDSDLSRLNAAPTGEWVSVPRELAAVLSASIRIGRMSDGAFDIGVGDLVNAWGFGADGPAIDAARIAEVSGKARKPAADILEVDEASMRIRKAAPITLDLSAIAKGFGVDELARCLDGFGLSNYLVGIDGEMRASGFKPGGVPWAVAVERPDRDKREALGVVDLANMAIATSGDYRHWIDIGGETISHTMDARRSGAVTQCDRVGHRHGQELHGCGRPGNRADGARRARRTRLCPHARPRRTLSVTEWGSLDGDRGRKVWFLRADG